MNKSVIRIIGAVLFAFGTALITIPLFTIIREINETVGLTTSAEVIVIACATVSMFCLVAGWRLTRKSSALQGPTPSPTWWTVLAIVFYGLGVMSVAAATSRREFQLVLIALGFAVLGFGSVKAGRSRLPFAAPSLVFPPETSLLTKGGFVPAGFQFGLEILNDNKTPMEFVVSVLENNVGLTRPDAIKAMLSIHTRGGALLRLASLEEANRIAAVVAAAVQANRHPLVCRAVSLDAIGVPDHPGRREE